MMEVGIRLRYATSDGAVGAQRSRGGYLPLATRRFQSLQTAPKPV